MVGKGARSVELRRKHVEAALACVLGLKAKEMGAFRARLQHLQRIGCPQLPSPGSGQPIAYTERHMLEMLIAVELEKLGQSPRTAANVAGSVVRMMPHDVQPSLQDHETVILVQTQGASNCPGYTMATGKKAISELLSRLPRVCSLVNVSALAGDLRAAVDKAASQERFIAGTGGVASHEQKPT